MKLIAPTPTPKNVASLRPILDLLLHKNVIIGSINRKGNVFIPRGKDMLQVGDSVVVVTTIQGLSDLDDIIKD